MIPKPLLATLVAGLLILPIALALVLGVASLLGGMGDELGAVVMKRIALGLGIVWALAGVCLVAVLGIQSLASEQAPGNGGQGTVDGEQAGTDGLED